MTTSSSNYHVAADDDDRENLLQHLPDDILSAVLLKFPRDSLHLPSAVSKKWRHMTSDPSFLQLYDHVHPPMSRFYLQDRNGICKCVPCAPTASPPPADGAEDLLKGVPKPVEPPSSSSSYFALGASEGLLFIGVTTITGPEQWFWNNIIYSPSAQAGIFIPIPWERPFYAPMDYHGLICDLHQPRFLLFRLRWTLDAVDIFDSHLRRWTVTSFKATFDAHRLRRYPQTFDVVGVAPRGGPLYWLFDHMHIISYDPCESELSLIRVPEHPQAYDTDIKCRRLMLSGDRIFFSVTDNTTLRMWILSKDHGSWTPYENVDLLNLFVQRPNQRSVNELIRRIRRTCTNRSRFLPYVLGMDPHDPSRLFLWAQSTVVSVNLRSKEVKKVCSDVQWKDYQMLPIYFA